MKQLLQKENTGVVTPRQYFISKLEKITGKKYNYKGVPTSIIYSALEFLRPTDRPKITGVAATGDKER